MGRVFVFGLMWLAGWGGILESATLAAPPNVVLILSDDQGWNDYSFMGHPHIRTPRIDRLAAESLVFTRGYVPDSLCRPSLASLITGRYPHQHGIVGNDPPPDSSQSGLSKAKLLQDPAYRVRRARYIEHIDDEVTLPDFLHSAFGAVSFQSGKWWEGNYSRGGFTHGMTHGDMDRGGRHGDAGLAIGREGMQPIFEFLDGVQKQPQPFFLWYAPMMPHSPHNPPERFLSHYRDQTPHLEIAKYWAMCEWFDETVGQLLDALKERDLDENTIVLYLADNGWINVPDADRPDERSKRSQYDGGTRTPIMVRWPGHVTPRKDEEHLATSLDLVPTVLSAAGIDVPPELPGIDLLNSQAVEDRKAIFGEILEHDIQDMEDPLASLRFRWVIDGEWKLIVPHRAREPEAAIELFHVTADPFEEHNLAESQPARVSALKEELDRWWPTGDR